MTARDSVKRRLSLLVFSLVFLSLFLVAVLSLAAFQAPVQPPNPNDAIVGAYRQFMLPGNLSFCRFAVEDAQGYAWSLPVRDAIDMGFTSPAQPQSNCALLRDLCGLTLANSSRAYIGGTPFLHLNGTCGWRDDDGLGSCYCTLAQFAGINASGRR